MKDAVRSRHCVHNITTEQQQMLFLESYNRVLNYVTLLKAKGYLKEIMNAAAESDDAGLDPHTSILRHEVEEDVVRALEAVESRALVTIDCSTVVSEDGRALVNEIQRLVNKEKRELADVLQEVDCPGDKKLIAQKQKLLRQLSIIGTDHLAAGKPNERPIEFFSMVEVLEYVESIQKYKYLELVEHEEDADKANLLLNERLMNASNRLRLQYIYEQHKQATKESLRPSKYVVKPEQRHDSDFKGFLKEIDHDFALRMREYTTDNFKLCEEAANFAKDKILERQRGAPRLGQHSTFVTQPAKAPSQPQAASGKNYRADKRAAEDKSDEDATYNSYDSAEHLDIDLPDFNSTDRQAINVLEEHDLKKEFYKTAKQQILGFNKPQNLNSLFFSYCREQNVVPFPFTKFLSNNCLKIVRKSISLGYAKAIASLLEQNQDQSLHVLELHLEDCTLLDLALATIL